MLKKCNSQSQNNIDIGLVSESKFRNQSQNQNFQIKVSKFHCFKDYVKLKSKFQGFIVLNSK